MDNTAIIEALYRIEKKLDKIDAQSNFDKEFLSTREACTFLSCSRTMLWKLREAGKIGIKQVGGRKYYITNELRAIINNATIT